jgi:hypothetical protein
MRRCFIACATALLASLTTVAIGANAVKPHENSGMVVDRQQRIPLKIDYANPPRSWAEAMQRADLVAVIRLRTQAHENSASGGHLPLTRFDADVVENIGGRAAGSIGKEIVVVRFGGISQGKSGVSQAVEETGFPAWKVGGVFLAFLEWSAANHGYLVQFGPDGAFEEEPLTKKVHTFGRGSLANSRNGRGFTELVAEVKAARR